MTTPFVHARNRRLIAGAAGLVLALAGLVVVSPSADAAPVPRTYAASFTSPSGPVTHGLATNYALSVKNTSTSISALDRIRITIPAGFTVVPGSVSVPGWTESLTNAQTLTAKTSKPLQYGLRKTQSLTVSFTATAPLGCDAVGPVTWPLSVDGILLVFSPTTPPPAVDVAAVTGPCASANASPAVPVNLAIEGGPEADLPNGANGAVSLVVSACTPGDQTDIAPCSDGTQVELSGNFKGLYTNDAPASITWVCTGDACGHPDDEGSNTDYLYNYTCPSNSCFESNTEPFGEREVEEDFAAFPVFVSLKTSEGYSDFVQAPRCVALPTGGSDPNKASLLSATRVGKIETAEAQALGFCVDVNAITRYASGTSGAQTFGGTLRIPVLFVEDPRVRP